MRNDHWQIPGASCPRELSFFIYHLSSNGLFDLVPGHPEPGFVELFLFATWLQDTSDLGLCGFLLREDDGYGSQLLRPRDRDFHARPRRLLFDPRRDAVRIDA